MNCPAITRLLYKTPIWVLDILCQCVAKTLGIPVILSRYIYNIVLKSITTSIINLELLNLNNSRAEAAPGVVDVSSFV